jgi:hypothetical protein
LEQLLYDRIVQLQGESNNSQFAKQLGIGREIYQKTREGARLGPTVLRAIVRFDPDLETLAARYLLEANERPSAEDASAARESPSPDDGSLVAAR